MKMPQKPYHKTVIFRHFFVTWEKPFDSTKEYSLNKGDEIAVTYTNLEIVENKDGSTEILVPEIEIIKRAE